MEKSFLITLCYDGTNYCGWQVQNNGMTIQEALMKAGRHFLPDGFTVTTASRTDSGVHAIGQRALVKAETTSSAEHLLGAFNAHLPSDIRLWQVEVVANDFHPRYHAKQKRYTYRLWNSRYHLPIYERECYTVHRPLDWTMMQWISHQFVGRHDFNAFSSSRKSVKQTERNIIDCQVIKPTIPTDDLARRGQRYDIQITGEGFLYHMVRIMAGTIVEFSLKGYSRSQIEDCLTKAYQTGKRRYAGPTLPAKGLVLDYISY